jgi:hypothetical protein
MGFVPPTGAPTIETSVLIAAPIASIWSILIDFGSYGEWNRYIPGIEGEAERGATIIVTPRGEAGKKIRVEALAPYSMYWTGGTDDRADFEGNHFFELEPVTVNETLFLHREYFTGRLARPFMDAYGHAIRDNFDLFNACLKAAAEHGFLPKVDPADT